MRSRHDKNKFSVEVTAIDLLKILSGFQSPEDILGDGGREPNALSILRKGLDEGREIEDITFKPSADSTGRDEDKVEVHLSSPIAPKVARSKSAKR